MKKLLFIFFIIFLLGSCKKDNSPSSSATVNIQVNEITSGLPVAGATVSLRRCAAFGCAFGIVEEFNGVTDNSGVVHVPQDKYDKVPAWNDATYITKTNYWPEIFMKATAFSFTPLGWISLRIIKGTNYPQGSVLTIRTERQTQPPNTAYQVFSNSRDFNAAADSIVILNGFGNQLNKIYWQVTNGVNTLNSGTWNQQIPRLDTIKNITLNY